METKPPYEIKPVDKTTQALCEQGKVFIGHFLALIALRKKLTQQERNKAKRKRRRAKEAKRGR